MSQTLLYQQLNDNCWLIDTGYTRSNHTACYLLHDDSELALIDTGVSNNAQEIIDVIAELGFDPQQLRYILPTHVHLDHAGAAGKLMALSANATLATHHKGLPHLIEPQRLEQGVRNVYGDSYFERVFGELTPVEKYRTQALHDHDWLPLGKTRILHINTPGHANHHGCFFVESGQALFTGDSFGLRYPDLDKLLMATTTPVAFDPEAWHKSLDRMMALQPTVALLTHFGPLHTPAQWLPMLRTSIDEHAEIALAHQSLPAGDKRQAAIANKLRNTLAQRWHLDAQQIETILATDIQLNAQGLDLWLQRLERRKTDSRTTL